MSGRAPVWKTKNRESEVRAVATPHMLSKGCCEASSSESRAEISQSRRQYSRRPLVGSEDGVAKISHAPDQLVEQSVPPEIGVANDELRQR